MYTHVYIYIYIYIHTCLNMHTHTHVGARTHSLLLFTFVSHNVWCLHEMNEQVSEFVSERISEWVCEWVSEWVIVWMSEWVGEWVNEWVGRTWVCCVARCRKHETRNAPSQFKTESRIINIQVSFQISRMKKDLWRSFRILIWIPMNMSCLKFSAMAISRAWSGANFGWCHATRKCVQ